MDDHRPDHLDLNRCRDPELPANSCLGSRCHCKFFVQAENGHFSEVLVVDPKQIAGQINEQVYSGLIAAELNLNINTLPAIIAENLKNTKLVRIWVRDSNIDRGINPMQASLVLSLLVLGALRSSGSSVRPSPLCSRNIRPTTFPLPHNTVSV